MKVDVLQHLSVTDRQCCPDLFPSEAVAALLAVILGNVSFAGCPQHILSWLKVSERVLPAAIGSNGPGPFQGRSSRGTERERSLGQRIFIVLRQHPSLDHTEVFCLLNSLKIAWELKGRWMGEGGRADQRTNDDTQEVEACFQFNLLGPGGRIPASRGQRSSYFWPILL